MKTSLLNVWIRVVNPERILLGKTATLDAPVFNGTDNTAELIEKIKEYMKDEWQITQMRSVFPCIATDKKTSGRGCGLYCKIILT